MRKQRRAITAILLIPKVKRKATSKEEQATALTVKAESKAANTAALTL